ncbi:MAG: trypsin-like peptidase domain-containing protein [Pirellulales bacterium]|nr:trypsin-like peptidase domain-containing protein [Pirellulales bacterium]
MPYNQVNTMDSEPLFSEPVAIGNSELHTRRPSNRLPLLLMLLLVVIVLALISPVMERIQYSRTRGEVLALRKELPELNLKALSKAFTLVYRQVKPSVVHIDTKRSLGSGRGDFFSMFGGRQQLYEAQGQASGVIIDDAGYIITNLHVVEDSEEIDVQLDDGRTFLAELIGIDPKIDLAVLKIDAAGLVAAAWGDSNQLEIGEMVWAIGNPFGLDQTITSGIVSQKGRQGQSVYQEFLQTDVAINPGNSGGPLVDINGEVLGINTAILGHGYQGISFAIPSNLVHESYEKIRKDGKVIRAFLGVELDLPTRKDIQQLGLPFDRPIGAIVRSVTPNSPAATAKLLQGDVITQWNGQPVADHRELTLMIARTPPDEKIEFQVIRQGKEITLEATVIEKPAALR